MPQPTVLWHFTLALAFRTAVVCRMERVAAGEGLKLELTDVRVDDGKALLAEHHAIGQAQPVDFALWTASPGAQIADRNG